MNSEGAKDLGEDALPLIGSGSDLFEKSMATTGMHSQPTYLWWRNLPKDTGWTWPIGGPGFPGNKGNLEVVFSSSLGGGWR